MLRTLGIALSLVFSISLIGCNKQMKAPATPKVEANKVATPEVKVPATTDLQGQACTNACDAAEKKCVEGCATKVDPAVCKTGCQAAKDKCVGECSTVGK